MVNSRSAVAADLLANRRSTASEQCLASVPAAHEEKSCVVVLTVPNVSLNDTPRIALETVIVAEPSDTRTARFSTMVATAGLFDAIVIVSLLVRTNPTTGMSKSCVTTAGVYISTTVSC